MSERLVKIAIALSLLCLVASAAFYVSSIEALAPCDAVASTEKVKEQKSGKNRRGLEGSFDEDPARGGREPAVRSEELVAEGEPMGDGDDGYEEDALGSDGLVAGSVFLKGKGVSFEEVQLYLVQTRAYEPAVPEEALPIDEGGEIVEEEEAEVELDEAPQPSAEGEQAQIVEEELAYEDYEYQEALYLDENGEFEHILAPGEYKLVARAPGHTVVAIEGIAVQAGEEVRGLVVELEEGLKVAGYVRSEAPEVETLEGLEVTLEGEGHRQTRYTDAQGAFEFEGLPKGTFKVSAFDTLVGKAERTARAGETTVALDMRFNELSGTVLDEMGMPVADVEVIGRGKYRLAAATDKDPHGSLDGMADPPPEELLAVEEQYAVTDEQGRFTMKMANQGNVGLSVQLYEDGRSAYLEDVPAAARGVQLRLSAGQELKLRVVKLPEGLAATAVDLTAEDELDSPFYTQSQSSGLGTMTFYVPMGVSWLLSYDKRAQIEVLGVMPSNVKLGELFVRGGTRLAAIKQPKVSADVQAQQW